MSCDLKNEIKLKKNKMLEKVLHREYYYEGKLFLCRPLHILSYVRTRGTTKCTKSDTEGR